MRLLPRARTVRRTVLGLGAGAVAGWAYGLLQSPKPGSAPASTSFSAPAPPEPPAVPAEIADALRAPEPEPVPEPILVPDPVAAEEPAPLEPPSPLEPPAPPEPPATAVVPDATEPVRQASSRARAKLSAATDALAEEGAEAPVVKATAKRAPKKAAPAAESVPDEA